MGNKEIMDIAYKLSAAGRGQDRGEMTYEIEQAVLRLHDLARGLRKGVAMSSRTELYKRIDAAAEAACDLGGTVPWTDLVVDATLAEVRAAVEEIAMKPNQFGLVEGEDIMALFEPGGRFGPGGTE